jgi:hypothetical protein
MAGRLKRFRGRSAAGFLDRPQDFLAGSHAFFGFNRFDGLGRGGQSDVDSPPQRSSSAGQGGQRQLL